MMPSIRTILYAAPAALALFSFAVVRAAEVKPPASSVQSRTIAAIQRTTPVDFEREILPPLRNNCLACHNQTKAKAGLILETPPSILKGGDSGPAIVPGKSAESLLLKAAAHQVADLVMPPRENKVNALDLSPEELGLLKLWIDQGAKGEVHGLATMPWLPLPDGLNPIYAIALSPDGQFAACGRANQIFIYHLPSRQFVTRLTDPQLGNDGPVSQPGVAHRDMVHALAFNSDGTLLASGDYRQAKIWRRPRNAQKFEVTLGASGSGPMLASPDGKWMAVARDDHTIKLWSLPGGKEAKVLTGHGNRITGLSFSVEGTRLASVSTDRSLRIWNVGEGDLLAQVSAPAELQSVTWIAEGRRVAAGGADGVIRIWTLPRPPGGGMAKPTEIAGHRERITALAAVLPGAAEIISGSADGVLRLSKMGNGELIREMKHGGAITAVSVRGDGKRFVSAGLNGRATLWNTVDGKAVAELKGNRYAQERSAEKERDLELARSEIAYRNGVLAAAAKDQINQTDRLKKAVETRATAVKAFTEKGKLVAAAKESKAAAEKAWADFTEEVKKVTGSFEAADQAAQRAATAAKQALEKALQAKAPVDPSLETQVTNEGRVAIEKALDEALAKAFAAGQMKPAFDKLTAEKADREKKAKERLTAATKALTDAENERKKAEQTNGNAEADGLFTKKAVDQAGDAVAAAAAALKLSEDQQKRAEAELASAQKAAVESEKPMRAAAFSEDGVTLVTAGDDQMAHTWSADDGAPFETYEGQGGAILSAGFLGRGVLVAGGADGRAMAWELNPDWRLERKLGTGDAASPIADRVNAVRFSPDGQWLASGSGEPSRSGEIMIWQVADGKLARELKTVHSDAVLSLDYSAAGQYLASGAADKFVRVIDVVSGKVVKSFEGHTHHVLGVSWKREGRTLASAGADNVVKIWDFITGERKKTIEGFAKEVTGIRFLGMTDQAVASSGDNQVRVVKENGDKIRNFEGVADFMYSVAVTADGRIAAAGGQDSVLRVWSVADGKPIVTFPVPGPDGKLAASQGK